MVRATSFYPNQISFKALIFITSFDTAVIYNSPKNVSHLLQPEKLMTQDVILYTEMSILVHETMSIQKTICNHSVILICFIIQWLGT